MAKLIAPVTRRDLEEWMVARLSANGLARVRIPEPHLDHGQRRAGSNRRYGVRPQGVRHHAEFGNRKASVVECDDDADCALEPIRS